MDATTAILNPAPVVTRCNSPAIDCLRGIAALGVMFFHARVALWVGWREIQAHPESYSTFERAVAWLSAPTPFLGALVMLFFVVSGFCVHQPLSVGAAAFRLGPYFIRRFLRIYPPYLAAVLVSAWVTRESEMDEPILSSVFMVQNYTAGRQLSSNPALWSLPVELELYLIYPVVWWLAARYGWRSVAVVVGAMSALALAAYHSGARVLEGNFAMYWGIWCSGAWLRERMAAGELRAPPWRLTLLATGGLPVAVWMSVRGVGGVTNLMWGGFFFWVAWAILAMRTRSMGWAGGLETALGKIGRRSYSLYLLHFPMLLMLGAWFASVAGRKPANFLVCLAACTPILPVVWVFYAMVERPSHWLARRLGRNFGTV